MVQKDAPGPISPLRARIGRVWALGAQFDPGLVFFWFLNNSKHSFVCALHLNKYFSGEADGVV